MTIGRIPRLIPAPRSRKTASPPARWPRRLQDGPVRQGSGAAKPSQPHPAPPSNRRPRRPSRRPRRPRARRRGAQASRQACASSNVIPGSGRQRSRIREGILATAGWRIHRVGKTGAKARKQSFAATVASAFGTTQAQTTGGWKKRPVVGASPPQSKSNEQPARPSPAGNSSTTTTQPSGRPKPAQPSTARAPDPGGSMPKLALANTELSRFAQAQDKWYQDGQ